MKSSKYNILLWSGFVGAAFIISISCANRVNPTSQAISFLSPVAAETPHTSFLFPTNTPNPAISPIIISDVAQIEGGIEIIIITNISTLEQNLKGMALLDPTTMKYILLPDVTLPPGSSFKIYNGPVKEINGIKWLDEPLLRQSGDYIILLNPTGRAIWYYVKP